MVDLRRPDPDLVLLDEPLYCQMTPGQVVVRIFQKTYSPVANFNAWGPTQRFDHHLLPATAPGQDPSGRAVYYCAFTLWGCMAEVFDDAIVLFERARSGIVQIAPEGIPLSARAFRHDILVFAQRTGMIVATLT